VAAKGFREGLETRRLRRPRLYDLAWEKPAPLVERYLRREVDERVSGRGEVVRAVDPADVERQLDRLLAEGIEALAVCLLNAYANPIHQRVIQEIVRRRAADPPCCLTSDA